jgi:hypothetical protein
VTAEAPAAAPAGPSTMSRLVLLAVVAVVVVEVLRIGAGVSGAELAASWQLLDVSILQDDPLRGTWYLHTQPPLFNAVVGVLAWSPLPLAGALFALDVVALLVVAFGVQDLLVRWRVPVVGATVAAGVAVANPALLSTIRIAGYEVLLAALAVALVWTLDRYLAGPTGRRLAAVVGLGLALVLTRALFHPLWLALVLAVVIVARRPPRRHVLLAAAVPVLVIGGLTAKNAALVGSPSLSSWTGFNLQRGVLGPMPAADVQAAIAAGDVTDLATQRPWQPLAAYEPWTDGCVPGGGHPALADASKAVRGTEVPNFNAECFVRLYDESQANAVAMIRREPLQYLADRRLALMASFSFLPLGADGGSSFLGEPLPSRSWLDDVFDVAMLRQRVVLDLSGRNIPLFGDTLPIDVAWTAVVAYLLVVAGAAAAAVRCWRGRPSPDGRDVIWVLTGLTVLFVVVGGDLVEFGENGRFRTMLDPLVVAFVAVAVTGAVRRARVLLAARAAR